jgi:hypothetical protein
MLYRTGIAKKKFATKWQKFHPKIVLPQHFPIISNVVWFAEIGEIFQFLYQFFLNLQLKVDFSQLFWFQDFAKLFSIISQLFSN